MFRRVVFTTVLSLAVAAVAHAEHPWITRDDYGGVSIVVADGASPSERFGAERFKEYWRKCTGFYAPLGSTPTRRIAVWIGQESVPPTLLKGVDIGIGVLRFERIQRDSRRQPQSRLYARPVQVRASGRGPGHEHGRPREDGSCRHDGPYPEHSRSGGNRGNIA